MKSDSRPLIVGTEDIAVVGAMCVCVPKCVWDTGRPHLYFSEVQTWGKNREGKKQTREDISPWQTNIKKLWALWAEMLLLLVWFLQHSGKHVCFLKKITGLLQRATSLQHTFLLLSRTAWRILNVSLNAQVKGAIVASKLLSSKCHY